VNIPPSLYPPLPEGGGLKRTLSVILPLPLGGEGLRWGWEKILIIKKEG